MSFALINININKRRLQYLRKQKLRDNYNSNYNSYIDQKFIIRAKYNFYLTKYLYTHV